ncbi:MAG: hypothetical protein WCI51_01030 [Lentisphaerota bacterium]
MKNDVTHAAAAAAVTYDPASGLETAKTALDNLKHALERLDKSAALDIQALAEIIKAHKDSKEYSNGYDNGYAQGYHAGLGKALTLIEIEFDKLAATTKTEGGKD